MASSSALTKHFYFDDSTRPNRSYFGQETDIYFIGKIESIPLFVMDSFKSLKELRRDITSLSIEMENFEVNLPGDEKKTIELLFFGKIFQVLGYAKANDIDNFFELSYLKYRQESSARTSQQEATDFSQRSQSYDSVAQRLSVMETGLANLQTSFEAFAAVANTILAKLDQIVPSGPMTTYQPEAAQTLFYQEEFTKSLCARRLAEAWRQKIKSYADARIEPAKLKLIKQQFLSGTSNPTKFVRNIAEIVFGKETLKKTAMGKDGKPLKGLKQGIDREIYFKPADEALMKDLISLVDKELFEDTGAFEYLVRRPINQAGRDAKKSKESEVQMQPLTNFFSVITHTSRVNK